MSAERDEARLGLWRLFHSDGPSISLGDSTRAPRSLVWTSHGRGATLQFLLANVVTAPFCPQRAIAAATIRRCYACGYSPTSRTNLALLRRATLTVEDFDMISGDAFHVTDSEDHSCG